MSGGVGADERDQMKSQANRYDLQLSFADHSGQYLSDVRVAIEDEHGKEIVNTITAGPWFYIDLPAGKMGLRRPSTSTQRRLRICKYPKATRRLDCFTGI
jgi:hypothetical protein